MGNMVQGAALGAAFGVLFASVADATRNIAHFNADLNRLESNLRSIKLVVDHNENFHNILERQQHGMQILIDRLQEGAELIQKCSKVKWNVFKRLYDSMKLRKLEGLLVIHFQIDVAAFIYRESEKISVELNNVNEKLNGLTTMLNKDGNGGYGLNGSLVGHDQSIQVKEGLQHEDGEVALEISSP